MIAVPVAVPEIVLPTTLRPAGKPWTHTVAPGDATITATNGRPTVPPRFEAVMVGSGQGSMVMFVVAVAPHAAVAVIVAVPAAAGVPGMMFPARVRPAGRLVAVVDAPTEAVAVERKGRPAGPRTASVATGGAGHAAMGTGGGARGP